MQYAIRPGLSDDLEKIYNRTFESDINNLIKRAAADGMLLYFDNKKNQQSKGSIRVQYPNGLGPVDFNLNIENFWKNYKRSNISNLKTEYDNDGTKLTKEQMDFFKDSKVVDDNGNLKVMYHGTLSAGFTRFNPGMIFLTDNLDNAKEYSVSNEIYDPNHVYSLDEMQEIFQENRGDDWKFTLSR